MSPTSSSDKQIVRVRKICMAMPGATEKLSHAAPSFFVRKKMFCTFADNHHGDGHVAVWVPAPMGLQAALIEAEPKKFFRPPYVGGKGWVGIEVARVRDTELVIHIEQAWRMVAPKKLVEAFEGGEE